MHGKRCHKFTATNHAHENSCLPQLSSVAKFIPTQTFCAVGEAIWCADLAGNVETAASWPLAVLASLLEPCLMPML